MIIMMLQRAFSSSCFTGTGALRDGARTRGAGGGGAGAPALRAEASGGGRERAADLRAARDGRRAEVSGYFLGVLLGLLYI